MYAKFIELSTARFRQSANFCPWWKLVSPHQKQLLPVGMERQMLLMRCSNSPTSPTSPTRRAISHRHLATCSGAKRNWYKRISEADERHQSRRTPLPFLVKLQPPSEAQ